MAVRSGTEWEPGAYDEDPMVNAVLNVARELRRLADATNGLLYGLKYGKEQGLSIAEAVEVGCKAAGESIATSIQQAAETLSDSE
ncbi:hypothetical protein WMF20_35460 [Sorangium sp. So ce834]|uniref:hypothetical protein n=1 Tax=Sorangium sp. So ce834 TaxID=3133321 RepID=UPI003F5DE8C8